MTAKELTYDRRIILSTLWIFVSLNYLYCDVISLMSAELLNALLTGVAGGIEMNEQTLLAAGIIMEVSIAMVLLSRVLKYKSNRITNIIAGILKTLIMVGTLLMGVPSLHYMFFATIEIATTLFIIWYAWTWKQAD
ncbi:DUF6326 family protein [Marivirga atlantica]|jgi:hypothetical protein|uniref:Uncharacterized protein n=1 Tax=Marivirga atlantica TaxID=1548457 RepID=A0A937AH08_9BACT|nr:DUF6326 family protein [Marivirga atlantica]MBL0765399.1 hypothetical protein [Marivirga atlantica]